MCSPYSIAKIIANQQSSNTQLNLHVHVLTTHGESKTVQSGADPGGVRGVRPNPPPPPPPPPPLAGESFDSQTSRSLDLFLSLAGTELRPVICRLRVAWET